ncbi:hypothetical protein GTY65_39660 [Streptomyces sp. SID8379]|uniref:hypothetical protein n=1 Tax=unclassified Streptomyces TaxID=2593676 RepID=UPI000381157B|nr:MULTISPECIES: hypothetical protein [unclassified Streptomyces]MYW70129.1 hypothetical protein [Streptomyces sp. SID8379]
MPARPTGTAVATARDGVFLRKALGHLRLPVGYDLPADDTVAVIHRKDDTTGELAWMPDGRTFCWLMVRRSKTTSACGSPPDKAPAPGLLFVDSGTPDQILEEGKEDQVRMVSFVIAEGGSRHFDHVRRASGAGPVQQVVSRFPSGRKVTFLTFDRPYGPIDSKAEICSADRKVCFPSQP